jgi:hypothetical protein
MAKSRMGYILRAKGERALKYSNVRTFASWLVWKKQIRETKKYILRFDKIEQPKPREAEAR